MELDSSIQSKKHPQGCFLALWAIVTLLVVAILAASWSPDSRMVRLVWVPGWLAELADRDPNARTAVPLLPLAFLMMVGLWWQGVAMPLFGSALLCGACLGLAEFGQIFLPNRTADGADLLRGCAGIAAGLAMAAGLRWVFGSKKNVRAA